ncbi:MAG: diadenylate cyclase CdaA [Clostridia bacterium]|nr:diadenylate cyclase CdaA [Clostridia bacterium]MBQ9704561.1 diadenylate cyclase CdaA [Clostridia bacterium]
MRVIWEYIVHFFSLFKMITVFDVIDILCLSAVFFAIYLFIKERRAGKLAIGVGIIFVMLIICQLLSLKAMQYILSHVIEVGIVLLVVIFQPEIRSALEKLGDNSIKGIKVIGEQKNSTQTIAMIDEIATATFELAKSKTGALIVFERNTKLGDLILTGTVINAQVSSYLLRNIFYDKAPLHDGAVIIRDNRIYSAGCLLPLSVNLDIIKDLGTRHRAAIGASENSDCVAVVVSEETGIVSITHEGHIYRNFTRATMKKKLEEYLVHNASQSKNKSGARIKMRHR